MREVRVALLEADVNLKVAKQFIANVSEKAVGQEVLASLNPAQQVIKIVNEELIALMGPSNAKLEVSPKPPTVILMCGLQGAGKTTLCGKLALQLKNKAKSPSSSRATSTVPPPSTSCRSWAGRRRRKSLKRDAGSPQNRQTGGRVRP